VYVVHAHKGGIFVIDVQQISRKYGDYTAVNNVSFHIRQGEIVGLLGHNGAGKSTIMKMLTGYLEPSRGEILIAGQELLNNRGAAQERIGYLPENCPVYPEMSVIDFLDYTATLRGLGNSKRLEAIRHAIAQTELQTKATAPIATLSRGYRQRVGVAQALLHQPEILILDEPTNGLDPSQIEHMRTLIRELGHHTTVMVSTHILQEVEAVCDRVLILRNGRLALDARLSDLMQGRGLLVTCNAAPDEALNRLKVCSGVDDVQLLNEEKSHFCYRLPVQHHSSELAPRIAAMIIEMGWQLYELRREEQTLEKVFHEISSAKQELSDAA